MGVNGDGGRWDEKEFQSSWDGEKSYPILKVRDIILNNIRAYYHESFPTYANVTIEKASKKAVKTVVIDVGSIMKVKEGDIFIILDTETGEEIADISVHKVLGDSQCVCKVIAGQKYLRTAIDNGVKLKAKSFTPEIKTRDLYYKMNETQKLIKSMYGL